MTRPHPALLTALLVFLQLAAGPEEVEARTKASRFSGKRASAIRSVARAPASKSARRSAAASSRSGGRRSAPSCVSGTNYFLPREGVTKNFKSEVKMQGSGILANGNILSYTGKQTRRPANCKTTNTSASGKCLMPYFSIAADPRYFKMGDVIYIPEVAELKMKVKIPGTNKEIEHPGYFVVEDTGGAIKGPNRFDFFTGVDDPLRTADNPFLKLGLTDKRMCKNHFSKVEPTRMQVAMGEICRHNLERPDCSGPGSIQIADIPGAGVVR